MKRKMSITVDRFVLQTEIRNVLLHPRVEAVHFFQRSFSMEPNTDFQETQSSCTTGEQTNLAAPEEWKSVGEALWKGRWKTTSNWLTSIEMQGIGSIVVTWQSQSS
ncbi:hypothetical protein BDP81DRAFT_436116 [Colletotrichum phormii]|uniref:Uncharacterized protein n=1 Tax=Colletotrichum phormii TaxID=359342 RepID=A0AAI9ZIG7_9PEZI|nr:uncharacterized protein BDP81DRAFT_436116 [Colletotrichum phormii]KAK1625091.1 hypothetical protein BDP81DRAFT_436116 [Colletotrichum phormii]